MDVKAMKNYKKEDDAYDVGTQFSKETHIRDEDDEMRKFIETEMSKVKGGAPQPEAEEDNTEEFLSPEDAALMSLPEHLTRSTFKKVIEHVNNLDCEFGEFDDNITENELFFNKRVKEVFENHEKYHIPSLTGDAGRNVVTKGPFRMASSAIYIG